MFGKNKKRLEGKQEEKKEKLNFETQGYIMPDLFDSDNLVVANLEFVSNRVTTNGPMVETTGQKYIFEKINDNGKIRFREVFTGFVADNGEAAYFNLPYVVSETPIKEVLNVADKLPKYGLLLVLNEINFNNENKKRR